AASPCFADESRPTRIYFKISEPLSHTKGLPDRYAFFATYTVNLDDGTFTSTYQNNGRLVGSMLEKLREAVGRPGVRSDNVPQDAGRSYYAYISGHGNDATLSGPVS